MVFNKAYNRAEFIAFLRTSFLPEDFLQETSAIEILFSFNIRGK